jgi:hypothetical protein
MKNTNMIAPKSFDSKVTYFKDSEVNCGQGIQKNIYNNDQKIRGHD